MAAVAACLSSALWVTSIHPQCGSHSDIAFLQANYRIMRIIAVIQARYSSQRLPGKILRPLAGKPMLAHVTEALTQCRLLDGILLATSTDPSDDAVADFARTNATPACRGSLDNVFSRMLDAALLSGADAIVRISGDSPLIDPVLVDQAVDVFRKGMSTDLVTNVFPRSFPKGQSVEIISVRTMQKAQMRVTDPQHQEHVTPYFYANAELYRIENLSADEPRPDIQLSVDTLDDFKRCEAILRDLSMPAWKAGWKACVAASDKRARPKTIA